eukprot:UN28982
MKRERLGLTHGVDKDELICQLEINVAKLKAALRLVREQNNLIPKSEYSDLESVVGELARKSTHLQASEAIIKQLRSRIEKLGKLNNASQDTILQNANNFQHKSRRYDETSAEQNRQVDMHKRQLSIINQKLSDAIMREEQAKSKLTSLKSSMNKTRRDHVEKIEQLEQALEALASSTNSKRISYRDGLESNAYAVECENRIGVYEKQIEHLKDQVHDILKQKDQLALEMRQKLRSMKEGYETEKQTLTDAIRSFKTRGKSQNTKKYNDTLNHAVKLGKSKNEIARLKGEIEVLRGRLTEFEKQRDELKLRLDNTSVDYRTLNSQNIDRQRQSLIVNLGKKCDKQKQEIRRLETLLDAAATELQGVDQGSHVHTSKFKKLSDAISSHTDHTRSELALKLKTTEKDKNDFKVKCMELKVELEEKTELISLLKSKIEEENDRFTVLITNLEETNASN